MLTLLSAWFKRAKGKRATESDELTLSPQQVLDILARTAQEMRAWLKVTSKRYDAAARTYELVLASGMDLEKIVIPADIVHDWLQRGDRTKEAEIRRLIIEAVDRMDLKKYRLNEQPGFYDWTGDLP